jgi:F0F1-type ATP synthase membrane subunit c/vacuolar-type H+-ATPase subunit K
MAPSGDSRQMLPRALAATGAVVVLVGLALVFFGVGADLSGGKTVTIVTRQDDTAAELAGSVKVGDDVYNDLAGARIGRVVAVKVVPQPRVTGDAQGRLQVVGDPILKRIDMTIEGTGRIGDGLVILGPQVVQVGRGIIVASKRYSLLPTVVSIDVR